MTDDLEGLLSPRSVDDLIAERVRVTLGEHEYVLPVLKIEREEAWRAKLDSQFENDLAAAGAASMPELLRVLDGQQDRLLDALIDFDETGVLPEKAVIRREATQMQVIRAVLGARQSVSPLVVIGLMTGLALVNLTVLAGPSGSLAPLSSPRSATAGPPATSAAN